eukprot:CAMPEP_0113897868 /NCGR_PEP_ID=MMETSP0780_2-20120614/18988_1 /TAXON_ID=652834 /ORGANISM="Palpitomonas bilix" /LENGTH=71 /DNA_ID=CAMNT_0000889519 /DNA_START=106 /DNA_END=318 /DNA_ORIENTATION=- /assembly_acc=CAM_ASM_000599
MLDLLAAGCNNGSILVWTVDTARTPPTFSSPSALSGVHSSDVLGLAFAASEDGDATILVSGEYNSGGVCVW